LIRECTDNGVQEWEKAKNPTAAVDKGEKGKKRVSEIRVELKLGIYR
jgi:hypothetical protein